MKAHVKSISFKYITGVILAFALLAFGLSGAYAQPGCPGKDPSRDHSSQWAGGSNNLLNHWNKHKGENSTWSDVDRYAQDAYEAIRMDGEGTQSHTIQNGPNAGRIMFWANDGTSGIPDSTTSGIFIVTDKNRKIISAFKPKRGEQYYEDQIKKDKPGDGPGSSSSSTRAASENDGDIWTIYTKVDC
ncbi:TPA: hypothetical protein NDU43_002102 [Pseudomonas aeruginosa]|nr:hypothetical protein [Pseudomonas aeruginosa]